MVRKFCENIKQLRKDAGLSQVQLAGKLGTTQRKISYLESGQIEPDLETLILLAKFFNVSIDFLVGLEV